MEHELRRIQDEALAALASVADQSGLERFRQTYLGRSGRLAALMAELPNQPAADRPRLGRLANQAKAGLQRAFGDRRRALTEPPQVFDPTLPGEKPERGHLHPLTQFTRRMVEIWRSLGYDIHEGPELELDWYNFAGLNIPRDHPSRDIQDTFYIKDHPDLVLRTHSSTVQLRALKHRPPPLKFVEIGRVYRHEATDASHESMFTQCDGVALGRDLTMAHLVTTLRTFFQLLFGPRVKIRVRPSYFPFVEPGIEMDMKWSVAGKTVWLEMLGAGMIHPNVIKAMKLDAKRWRGFAWGMGVDRLMMLHYGIPDVRLSYSGDLEFLKQF
ncbi:MAG: phenylalanine--tRNA ligase subunit alpha [Candidatus Kerfeldbacteria bacterium]|nr:phenylalanine--tRNA ligase subunit alpha [Candidatus Kerfeldbacteria bacterium]